MLSNGSNSRLSKLKPPKRTGKENKSRSTFPGISRPSNLGMKTEPIRSSNGWNKQEERVQTRKKSFTEMINHESKQNKLHEVVTQQ